MLTTDGIPEAACEQYLRACGPLSPRELAAGVVACASESEPDDRTAVIVQLDPASMQPHHTTRRARSMSKTGAETPHLGKYFLSKHKIPARIRPDKDAASPYRGRVRLCAYVPNSSFIISGIVSRLRSVLTNTPEEAAVSSAPYW